MVLYPTEILPNPSRKLISCNIQEHYLIRSTNTSVLSDLIDEDTGDLKQTHICSPSGRITDLSTSLFGIFNLTHNNIELTADKKKHLGAYCEPDCAVEVPIYEIDFYFNENRGYWTVPIDKIQDETVEYFIGNKPNEIFSAICKVIHTPAIWNFWHFSVRWYLVEHQCYLDSMTDEKLKSKITKRLSGNARAMLAKFAKVIEPTGILLPESCYTKPTAKNL
jgi:hypothetical protein